MLHPKLQVSYTPLPSTVHIIAHFFHCFLKNVISQFKRLYKVSFEIVAEFKSNFLARKSTEMFSILPIIHTDFHKIGKYWLYGLKSCLCGGAMASKMDFSIIEIMWFYLRNARNKKSRNLDMSQEETLFELYVCVLV